MWKNYKDAIHYCMERLVHQSSVGVDAAQYYGEQQKKKILKIVNN